MAMDFVYSGEFPHNLTIYEGTGNALTLPAAREQVEERTFSGMHLREFHSHGKSTA